MDAPHRRRGLARAMVRHALEHPDHQGLRRWMLFTQDAHPLYHRCGFELDPHPERIMTFGPPVAAPVPEQGGDRASAPGDGYAAPARHRPRAEPRTRRVSKVVA